MVSDLDVFIRLVAAFILGGIIGYERQSRSKAAGLRTHILVCLGSCLVMILSLNIYHAVQGLTNADPARLAAQVVSGIGFLGAGTIMKEGSTVRGLTTAASVWVVSGVGLAVGSGYYFGALFTTFLVFLTLTILSRFERPIYPGRTANFVVHIADRPGQIGKIGSCLGTIGVSIRDIKIDERNDGTLDVALCLSFSDKICTANITESLMKVDGVLAVRKE